MHRIINICRFCILMFFLTVGYVESSAQIISNRSNEEIVNKLAIKSTLSAPLEMYSGFNIGVEYAVLPNLSLQHSYNTLRPLFTETLFGGDLINLSGYRFRNELRYYGPILIGEENMYIAAEICFDKISFDKYRTFEFKDEQSGRTYYHYSTMRETKLGRTYNLKVGYVYRITDSIFIDIFSGIGIRDFYKITYDFPADVVKVHNTNGRDNLETSEKLPNFLIGIALGWRLK